MQVNIVVPGIAEEMSRTDESALHRSDGRDRPYPDQAGASRMGRFWVGPLYLGGQRNDLNKKHRHQHQRVLITDKEVFHDDASGRGRTGAEPAGKPRSLFYSIEI